MLSLPGVATVFTFISADREERERIFLRGSVRLLMRGHMMHEAHLEGENSRYSKGKQKEGKIKGARRGVRGRWIEFHVLRAKTPWREE
jgi:hypothetical protein